MRIILYGIGKGMQYIKTRLSPDVEIVGYSDSYVCLESFCGIRFIKPENIANCDFDYVVLTMTDRKVALKLADELEKKYGIRDNTIIPFFCCCNTEKYRLKLNRSDAKDTKYLILGNSHSFYGILDNCFMGSCINLSVRAQDIYFEYCVLNKALEKLENLKCIIIDLFDYTLFNVDTSLGRYIDLYYLEGGILLPHNLANNENFGNYGNGFEESGLFEEFMYSICSIDVTKKGIADRLTKDLDLFWSTDPANNWIHVDANKLDLDSIYVYSGKKRYERTIKNNIELFTNMIDTIKNKGIRIVFTILPRYFATDNMMKQFLGEWEEEFFSIINRIKKEFQIPLLNYKYSEIAHNDRFFCDESHLNTVGAYAQTFVLCDDLKRLGLL